MHKARSFFFVCAGIFLLALAFHLGAMTATAQSGSIVTGFAASPGNDCGSVFWAMTQNGDIFGRTLTTGPCGSSAGPLYHIGNFWSGSPTPATQETWGQLKSRYRRDASATQDK